MENLMPKHVLKYYHPCQTAVETIQDALLEVVELNTVSKISRRKNIKDVSKVKRGEEES